MAAEIRRAIADGANAFLFLALVILIDSWLLYRFFSKNGKRGE